jgi:hypothetical protein
MSFEHNIKDWVNVDNQIKLLNDRTRALREERSELHDKILLQVQDNNLEQSTIQITDGTLKFPISKATKPLTLRYVQGCLADMLNTDSVDKIMTHIRDKREVARSKEIRRYYS